MEIKRQIQFPHCYVFQNEYVFAMISNIRISIKLNGPLLAYTVDIFRIIKFSIDEAPKFFNN